MAWIDLGLDIDANMLNIETVTVWLSLYVLNNT